MNRSDLGNFIRSLREEANMERKELAALLGVSTAAVCQYENNGSIKTEKLYQIAEIFGVTLDEILGTKRAEMTLEEKLEEKYSLNEFDLHKLIDESNPKSLTEYFKRIKSIKDRFYPLVIKTIFHKRSTEEEEKELQFLWQFFEETANIDQFMFNAVIAQHKRDESAIQWELEKIYFFDRTYFYDEESDIDLIDYIMWNINDLWEEEYYDCFQAMIESMSKIERNLLFSDMIFDDCAPAIFHKVFVEQGAELLYPPRLKNKAPQDDNLFEALEGSPEFDERITEAVKIYSNKTINDFDYQEFLSLTRDEYIKCVDRNLTEIVKKLEFSSSDDLDVVWNIYKNLRIYSY